MRRFPPQRLICLTEETVETLYLLGEQDRIVGVSGYAVRPPEVRSKPRVSAFTSARGRFQLSAENANSVNWPNGCRRAGTFT